MLSEKEKALVGIGSSVAAGCQPCTRFHIKAARAAGACERGVRLAIETGLAARETALEAMALWARAEQEEAPVLDPAFRQEKEKLAALISFGATIASSSTVNIASQLSAVHTRGWDDGPIAEAVTLARGIRAMAAKRLDAVLSQMNIVPSENSDGCCAEQNSCDCANHAGRS